MTSAFRPLVERLASGLALTPAEADGFFAACLRGEPTPVELACALTALKVRGESPEEIAAGARALRGAALRFDPGCEVIDTCGTGGDGAHTYNISTASAFVAAGGGLKVAKHGGGAVSSRSGAAEVLRELGVDPDCGPERSRLALAQAGVCFLHAPLYNPAMRHVRAVRAELGFRTLFNLLGPLANPAGARRQVLGVYDPERLELMARVLGELGAERAWVVHGAGLDEIATTGETQVAEWRDGAVRRFTVTPEEVGLPRTRPEALRGGDPAENACALEAVLNGAPGAYRDIVLLNAAAAFVVGGAAADLAEGLDQARRSIDTGGAAEALARLRAVCGGEA